MTKSKKHIKENNTYINADELTDVYLTNTKQVACHCKRDRLTWHGEIQKIYLDKNGEAIGYDVYIY